VHFDAKDTDPGSGVDPGTITPDVTVSTETSPSGTVVNGSAKDTAGNLGTDSVTVKLDKTAPSISGAIISGTKGGNGWYVGPVTVHFTCSDGLSGVAVCPTTSLDGQRGKPVRYPRGDGHRRQLRSARCRDQHRQREPHHHGVNVAVASTPSARPRRPPARPAKLLRVPPHRDVHRWQGQRVGTFTTPRRRRQAGNTSTIDGSYQSSTGSTGSCSRSTTTGTRSALDSVFKAAAQSR